MWFNRLKSIFSRKGEISFGHKDGWCFLDCNRLIIPVMFNILFCFIRKMY